MQKNHAPAARATHNEKMIEIRVWFWTNHIAKNKGEIIPKEAWDSGMVAVAKNKSHGLKGWQPEPFNSLSQLPAAIEKVLMKHKITLYHNRRSKKYFIEGPTPFYGGE